MYKIDKLMKLDRKIYHSKDLAIVWEITNKNTLYTTIKRYVQKGVLIPIYKGLYSTVPSDRLDPVDLGRAVIHKFAYLSTESVLVQAGVISQAVYPYTFVSSWPKKINVGQISFLIRKLKDEYLFHPAGIINDKGFPVAGLERAVADMLYFNPRYHFDVPDNVDWQKVKLIQKEVGYL